MAIYAHPGPSCRRGNRAKRKTVRPCHRRGAVTIRRAPPPRPVPPTAPGPRPHEQTRPFRRHARFASPRTAHPAIRACVSLSVCASVRSRPMMT